jgi:hypothetical protein
MYFKPKNDEIYHIFERLTKYPVVKVNPKLAQQIGRYGKIRYLSKNNNIWIKKGIIGLPPQIKIKKKGNGFDFYFK